jgi:hypothetical protein
MWFTVIATAVAGWASATALAMTTRCEWQEAITIAEALFAFSGHFFTLKAW